MRDLSASASPATFCNLSSQNKLIQLLLEYVYLFETKCVVVLMNLAKQYQQFLCSWRLKSQTDCVAWPIFALTIGKRPKTGEKRHERCGGSPQNRSRQMYRMRGLRGCVSRQRPGHPGIKGRHRQLRRLRLLHRVRGSVSGVCNRMSIRGDRERIAGHCRTQRRHARVIVH